MPKIEPSPPGGKPQNEGQFERQTVAALERQLALARASIRRRIRARVTYHDKVKFLSDQPFAEPIREALAATHCGKPPGYHPSLCMQWPYSVEISQPSSAAFACLAALLPDHHIVSYLEIARDYITETIGIARVLARELNLVTTQPRRGSKRKTGRSGDTFYLAARKTRPDITAPKTRRNAAVYPCLSKITGQPAAHICFRLGNSAVCEARGARTAADLLARDPATLITKEDFRLTATNWAGVDRLIARLARAHAKGDAELQAEIEQQWLDDICNAIDRQMPPNETLDDLTAQDLLDAHPLLRRRGAAVHRPFDV